MINVVLGYFTLKKAAKEWGYTVYDLVEWGANGILKIWNAKEIRRGRVARPLSANHLNSIYEEISPDISDYVIATSLVITKDEFNRFGRECGLGSSTEKDYPRELQIALEVWREVLGDGIKESSLNKSKSKAVKNALMRYNLKTDTEINRIANVVVSDKTGPHSNAITTTEHSRNEPGHPYYSKSLEIAVDVWKRIEGGSNLKNLANMILESFYSEHGDNQTELIRIMVAPGN